MSTMPAPALLLKTGFFYIALAVLDQGNLELRDYPASHW